MDYEGKFKKLKEDYDGLLEKSQNDLVKIRLREKSLNDSLAQLTKQKQQLIKEKQQIKTAFEFQIDKLQQALAKVRASKNQASMIVLEDSLELKQLKKKHQELELLLQKENKRCEDFQKDNLDLQTNYSQLEATFNAVRRKYQQASQKTQEKELSIVQNNTQSMQKQPLPVQTHLSHLPCCLLNVSIEKKVKAETEETHQVCQQKYEQLQKEYSSLRKAKQDSEKAQILLLSQRDRKQSLLMLNLQTKEQELNTCKSKRTELIQQLKRVTEAQKRNKDILEQQSDRIDRQNASIESLTNSLKALRDRQLQRLDQKCHKCLDLQQEIALMQQIGKSTKMMLQARQLEIERLTKGRV